MGRSGTRWRTPPAKAGRRGTGGESHPRSYDSSLDSLGLRLGQVDPAGVERLAAHQAQERQQAAAAEAVTDQGEPRVLRAGGGETARRREERRQPALVQLQEPDGS